VLRRQLSNFTRRVARQPTTVVSGRGGDSGVEHVSFTRTGKGGCQKGRDGRSGGMGCLATPPTLSEGVHELQGKYLGLIREIEGPEEIFE
jgi:hypothetical protein